MNLPPICRAALLAAMCFVMNQDGLVEPRDPYGRTTRRIIASVPPGKARDTLKASFTAAIAIRRDEIRRHESGRI